RRLRENAGLLQLADTAAGEAKCHEVEKTARDVEERAHRYARAELLKPDAQGGEGAATREEPGYEQRLVRRISRPRGDRLVDRHGCEPFADPDDEREEG